MILKILQIHKMLSNHRSSSPELQGNEIVSHISISPMNGNAHYSPSLPNIASYVLWQKENTIIYKHEITSKRNRAKWIYFSTKNPQGSMPRISTQRLVGQVSRAIWTENERKQLKCECILTDTESPPLLNGCPSKWQELHVSPTGTAACVWHTGDSESIYQTGSLEVRFVECGQYTRSCSWWDRLSKSREKGKRMFTPRNKCVHTGTHVSFILWHSELSTHASPVFPQATV